MFKPIKIFLAFMLLLSFCFSTMAYTTQFADEARTVRLHWKNGSIPIALSTAFNKQNPNIKSDSDVLGAVKNSLAAWEKAANIKFELVTVDKLSVSPSGKAGDGINLITIAQTAENLAMFGSDTDDVSARTRIFYNKKGLISEADIVLNPYQQFSTDGSVGSFDLEATLTHEIGHLLGLEHSSVFGATMHAQQGKNGIYNLAGFSARTLSEDDIAGVRAIYGAKESDKNCCGTIVGKLSPANYKSVKVYQVWAEETDSGRVVADVQTNNDGDFRFESLPVGEYNVFAQTFESKQFLSAQKLGTATVASGKIFILNRKIDANRKNFDVQYVGFNGQISDLAVPINGGNSYLIYVGGKNLDENNVSIGFNSSYITVTPNTIERQDYGDELSVVSFEIKVSRQTPVGEYSFFVKSREGETGYIVGGLTVENFINPWNSYFILGDE